MRQAAHSSSLSEAPHRKAITARPPCGRRDFKEPDAPLRSRRNGQATYSAVPTASMREQLTPECILVCQFERRLGRLATLTSFARCLSQDRMSRRHKLSYCRHCPKPLGLAAGRPVAAYTTLPMLRVEFDMAILSQGRSKRWSSPAKSSVRYLRVRRRAVPKRAYYGQTQIRS